MMETKRNGQNTKWFAAVLAWSLLLAVAHGQITAVSPDSATQGTSGLTVQITLDPDTDPPLPPTEAPVESVMIGTLSGTSVNRVSETVVTAVFDIPASEATGLKDVSVTFPSAPPENQDPANSGPPMEGQDPSNSIPPEGSQDPINSDPLPGGQGQTFTLTGGFAVTAMPDTAPTIITQPQSKAVWLGYAVTLTVGVYGSEPMSYQWQKDDIIIEDTNSASYTLTAFSEADTGEYRCFVSNEFGVDLSDVAVLSVDDSVPSLSYPIVQTGQVLCYGNNGEVLTGLESGDAFYGQDGHYQKGAPISYTDNGDGTVTDNVTGLMWAQEQSEEAWDWEGAATYCSNLTLGGYDDWRLPTLKELWSIRDQSTGWPYVDTTYFHLVSADGAQQSEQHTWSSNDYLVDTPEAAQNVSFIVNDWTGHIKALEGRRYVRPVRGDVYGINKLVDNGDSTITDEATGLMWAQDDSGEGMNWEDALAYAEDANYAGYDDWRLPNVKELQSIVDYSGVFPAIDSIFMITGITNEAGNADYPYCWTSTSAGSETVKYFADYVAFGYAVDRSGEDSHGAGAVRFDTKVEDGPSPEDDERIYNFVRLVRDAAVAYPVVDTSQSVCSDAEGNVIDPPSEGEAYYGQDAQFDGTQPSFIDNGDGIVIDNVTGLMWQQTPESSGYTWQEAVDYCEDLVLAEYDDWRIPTTKELFSISDFSQGWPYLNTDYFDLAESGEVTKDEQYWADYYVGITVEGGDRGAAFGVNHATGHIKAYAASSSGPLGGKRVRAVRGGNDYGVNDFVDNGDGTITDRATGLMWQQVDSVVGMDWPMALAYAEELTLADCNDWRLPNVKELQSIVDYRKSPSASDEANLGPAIDTDFFSLSMLPEGTTNTHPDYGYYWTSTSAYFGGNSLEYYYAWYVAFGTAVNGEGADFHGAGGVRFDTKIEGGPLGEGGERYYNYVLCVRDAE